MSTSQVLRKVESTGGGGGDGANGRDDEVEGVDIFGGGDDTDPASKEGEKAAEVSQDGEDEMFLVSQELREQEEKSRKENAKVEAKESKEDVDKIQVLTKEER